MRHVVRAVFGVVDGPRNDSWKERGLCRNYGWPDLWFPEGRGLLRGQIEAQAVEVCRRCPMLQRCRQYALENKETFGVWAALTESELRKLVGKAGS